MRVGINGFGRIGRNVFRAAAARSVDFEIVAVNDLMDLGMASYLLRYDSVLGRFAGEVDVAADGLVVNGRPLRVLSERDPAALPWAELGVEVVVESTGLFTKRDGAAKHLEAGARKVIISAPATEPDITVCVGVNDDRYDPSSHHVISNASCTTNCLAPLAKVL
ncbi:MAG TPA: glyceraldehyde 3-phosphate dehydrogenase NAD-binding domain-containing protein, partial [Gaiellales bacterium]|nr:glyceraldehyde 3-phosphate dehydrogenase NAD-binding domain-containing protein [Gaiellales bacterium]